jgi:hypothetical protein
MYVSVNNVATYCLTRKKKLSSQHLVNYHGQHSNPIFPTTLLLVNLSVQQLLDNSHSTVVVQSLMVNK